MACNITPSARFVPDCNAPKGTLTKQCNIAETDYWLPGDTVIYDLHVSLKTTSSIDAAINDFPGPAITNLQVLTPGWSIVFNYNGLCTIFPTVPGSFPSPGDYVIKLMATIDPLAQGLILNNAYLFDPYNPVQSAVTINIGVTLSNPTPATAPQGNFSHQYTVANGSGTASVVVVSGDIPFGLTLSPTGLLSGTLTADVGADFDWIIMASDVNGSVAYLSDTLEVV